MGGRRTKLSRDLMVMFKTIAFLQILLEYTHHSASKCDYAFSKFCIKCLCIVGKSFNTSLMTESEMFLLINSIFQTLL